MSELSSTLRPTGLIPPWLKTPWAIVVAVPLAVLIADPQQAAEFVEFAIRAFLGTLPYIAMAVIMIAWLKAAGAEAYVAAAFRGRENRMIVFAALLGGLAPFCSCEVIPFIAGLLALGAPLSAIMAFWLSSPLIDPPTLFITAAALGWPFAIGKAVVAVSLGLFGGFTIRALLAMGLFSNPVRQSATSKCGCGPSPFDGKPVWRFWGDAGRRDVFRTAFSDNALFLMKWLALAYVLEAVLVTYVPASMIASAVGGEGVVPIVVAAVIGMPAYLNGYVAPPLLAGLVSQGMTPGAAMAFLTAGAVSSIPAMTAVWSLVHRGVFAAYISLGFCGAVLAGILFQLL